MFSVNCYKNGITVSNIKQDRNPLQKLILENPKKHWHWSTLGDNPNITYEFIQKNPQLPWKFDYMDENPSIPWNVLLTLKDYDNFNIAVLSSHPSVTWNVVQDHPEVKWDADGLCMNPNISWKIIQENPLWNWDYELFCSNPNVTMEFLEKTPEITISWYDLSSNRNITWKDVHNHMDGNENWSWEHLSANPSVLTQKTYQARKNLWNPSGLAKNPNFDVKIAEKLGDGSRYLWENPNWTYKGLSNRISDIHFKTLSNNKFLYDPVVYDRLITDKKNLRRYMIEC